MAPGRTARRRGENLGSRGDAKSVSRRDRASQELRKTGIDVLGDMLWGSHFCLFYESKQDLFDTLVPYFKAGLESNEFCFWVVSEPLTLDEARDALRQGVPDFDRYFAEGSIEFFPGREWYLKENEFGMKRVIDGWMEKLQHGLNHGFEGMRASANAFWLSTKYHEDFCDYENEVNGWFAGKPIAVLCTYPLTASQAADILDVARAHQFTFARRKGDWEMIESPEREHAKGNGPLTKREREVLAWVAQGKSAWEIGKILKIAKRTVDEHAATAYRKLGAVNRTQAVAIAVRDRLISGRE